VKQCQVRCCPAGHEMCEIAVAIDEVMACDSCTEVVGNGTSERALYCRECDYGRCGLCVVRELWPDAFPWHLGHSSNGVTDAVFQELGIPKRTVHLG